MARLHVEIVIPERRLAKLDAAEVVAPGALGLFGVRPGHAPFLALMQPGPLTVREANRTTEYFVSGGFVEVGGGNVRVLADAAELVDEIDVPAVQARLAEAQARLGALGPEDPRLDACTATVRIEARRLEVAKARKR